MKHIIALTLSIIVGIDSTILQGQTIHTTAHEAILPIQLGEHENIRIYKDTLLFEEHFEHFLSDQVNTSTPIGGTSSLCTLPSSLTRTPYCRAKDIMVKYDSTINKAYCQLNKGSSFATPKMDIPAGSVLEVKIQATNTKRHLLINDTDVEVKKQDTIIKMPLQSLKEIVISREEREDKDFKIYFITITSPRDILAPANYTLNDDTLRITNLSPSTKYHIEIIDSETNEARHYTFETKKQIENPISRIQGANTIKLAWTNNATQTAPTLHLYKVNNATRDLLFSRIATKSSNYGLEIYNGTGKDICLGDYEMIFISNDNINSPHTQRYKFTLEDTIHKDTYIMMCGKLDSLNTYEFITFPVIMNYALSGGTNSCMLLKKDLTGEYRDTIDLFGRIVPGSSTASLSYKNSILTRKANITTGIKHNPQTTPVYFKNPASEWDSVYFEATYLNADSMKHKLEHPITYSPIHL